MDGPNESSDANWSADDADAAEQRTPAWTDTEDNLEAVITSLPDDQPEADRLEQSVIVPLDDENDYE
jgi:hypothetical protein